jgi:hypothetical protein
MYIAYIRMGRPMIASRVIWPWVDGITIRPVVGEKGQNAGFSEYATV